MKVMSRHTGRAIAANSTNTLYGMSISAFLPKTAGTITVINALGVTVVDAVPVAAGVYVPIPLDLEGNGGTFTTAGGASGTLFS